MESEIGRAAPALAFGIVCLSVIWLRNARPDLPRPFRVPLGCVHICGVWIGTAPALGLAFCMLMVVPLLWDIVSKAARGDTIPARLLAGYMMLGAAMYLGYGIRHSKPCRGMAHSR